MKASDKINEEKLNNLLKGSENPFHVPDGYFEKLPAEILHQIEGQPDFEKQASQNPFTVPDGYFEQLPARISDRIAGSEKPSFAAGFGIFRRPRLAIPLAFASLLLLAGIFYFTRMKTDVSQKQELTFDDLRNSDYLQTFDEELFVDIIENQNIKQKNDNIEQYLIDNEIDVDQIENAL